MIVAIDGPAASGKGTLGKRLAAHFGFDYLDTGALYRGVALRVLRAAGDPGDPETAAAAAALTGADLDDPRLRDEAVSEAASRLAAIPSVREALLAFQQDFAANPPGGRGAVLDGRDIGTVVCPEARAKLFVEASLEVRARRRAEEIQAGGGDADGARILAHMRARDARDRRRGVAPAVAAADAFLLDTTNLDIDSAFAAAEAFVTRRLGRSGARRGDR